MMDVICLNRYVLQQSYTCTFMYRSTSLYVYIHTYIYLYYTCIYIYSIYTWHMQVISPSTGGRQLGGLSCRRICSPRISKRFAKRLRASMVRLCVIFLQMVAFELADLLFWDANITIYLSICLSVCLSVCLSIPSYILYIYMYVHIWYMYVSYSIYLIYLDISPAKTPLLYPGWTPRSLCRDLRSYWAIPMAMETPRNVKFMLP